MKKFVFGLSAAVLISAAITPAFADTIVNTQVEQGPPAVVDSWMQPSVVRSREIKTSDGESQVISEPIVQERHERVVIPTTEKTTTTVVNEPKVIRRYESQTAVRRTVATAPRKKIRRAHKRRRAVAYKRAAVSKRDRFISQKVVEEYREPTVVQQSEQQVRKDVVIERRHPALDLY